MFSMRSDRTVKSFKNGKQNSNLLLDWAGFTDGNNEPKE